MVSFPLLFLLAVLYGTADSQFIHFQPFSLEHFNGTVLADGVYDICTNPFDISFEAYHRIALRNRNRVLPLKISGNVVVVDINGRRVMVDTGVQLKSFFQNGGQLFNSMTKAGITPESIDDVILTHAHSDHFLGLLKEGEIAFPNAVVYISKVDHQFWSNPLIPPGVRSESFSQEGLEYLKNLYLSFIQPYAKQNRFRLLDDKQSVVPGVSIRLAPGHSAGHAIVEYNKGGSRFSAVGDLWHLKDMQFRNVHTGISFDANSTMAAITREKVLNMLLKRRDLVLAFHENFPGLGYIRKRKNYGFGWVAANVGDLQPNLAEACDSVEVDPL